jgi:hypothetical protein
MHSQQVSQHLWDTSFPVFLPFVIPGCRWIEDKSDFNGI